jgi:hypothetical protein
MQTRSGLFEQRHRSRPAIVRPRLRATLAGAALILGAVPTVLGGQRARADYSVTTYSTPGGYSYTVPTGAVAVVVTASGSAGAGPLLPYSPFTIGGGLGGRVVATVAVVPGEYLNVIVGNTTGTGGGGPDYFGYDGIRSGGGYSGVFRGSQPLAIAGGGGSSYNDLGVGGAGGAVATPGITYHTVGGGGGGGTPLGAGAGGCSPLDTSYCGSPGGYLYGGASSWGGGGGGGYYGGGGGDLFSPGGGGSSYASPAAVIGSPAFETGVNPGFGSVTIVAVWPPSTGPVTSLVDQAANTATSVAGQASTTATSVVGQLTSSGGAGASSACTAGTVLNATNAGLYTMLRAQSDASTGGHVWVCARIDNGSTVRKGVWVDVSPGGGAPLPTLNQPLPDSNYQACQHPPPGYSANAGPGKLSEGNTGDPGSLNYAAWRVDAYTGTGPTGPQAWLCLTVAAGSTTTGERVVVSESPVGLPSGGLPAVTPHWDPSP